MSYSTSPESLPAGKCINCAGRLLDLRTPALMGIINLTPDSFFAHSRISADALLDHVGIMLSHHTAIVDLGACSTRPGSEQPSQNQEADRLLAGLELICKTFPNLIVSVDTYRSAIAEQALKAGASMINDVSSGRADAAMFGLAARYRVPYVLTHSRGTPQTMQSLNQYENIIGQINDFFGESIQELTQLGLADIILDPGIGFAKNGSQNFQILKNLQVFGQIGHPILVGISRKSFISKHLGVDTQNSLNGTTALHTHALLQGANILRVHDTQEASQVISLFNELNQN